MLLFYGTGGCNLVFRIFGSILKSSNTGCEFEIYNRSVLVVFAPSSTRAQDEVLLLLKDLFDLKSRYFLNSVAI